MPQHTWVDAAGGFPDPTSTTAFYDAMNAISQALAAVNPDYVAPTWAKPTTGTSVSAAWMNDLEARTSATPTGGGSGSGNGGMGWFTPETYGAAGDGATIDRAAVQTAITAAHGAYVQTGATQRVYLSPKVYLVDAVDYHRADQSIYGAVSLMLSDGVELCGPGTIRVKNNAYGNGAFYAVIRSIDTGISHARITGITVDGNAAGNPASIQCSNIVLEALDDVEVIGVRSLNANGNAIMVRGTIGRPMSRTRISGCIVAQATAIGIQCAQFNVLEIDNNLVTNTADNGIDIYGENGSTSVSGYNFRIVGNHVDHGLVGVFLETVAAGVVTGNVLRNCTGLGASVNRINGAPLEINIVGNHLANNPVGVRVTGDTGGVTIRGNTIAGASQSCVQLGGGGGNVSYVYVLDNTLDTATLNSVPLVSVQGRQAAFNRHRGTITQNTDRSKDTVTTASIPVGNAWSAANAA